MPQYAPQLGTRIGLTAQFVANGRVPCTPGASGADALPPAAAEVVARDEVDAVTAGAALRSGEDVARSRPDADRCRLDVPPAGGAVVADAGVAGAADGAR